jgi:hypothetical protein
MLCSKGISFFPFLSLSPPNIINSKSAATHAQSASKNNQEKKSAVPSILNTVEMRNKLSCKLALK